LLPLFVEVALTFALMFGMMFGRGKAIRRGETRLSDISLREPNGRRGRRNSPTRFGNQFELPVLFYVLTILSIITRHADLISSCSPGSSWCCGLCKRWFSVPKNDVRQRARSRCVTLNHRLHNPQHHEDPGEQDENQIGVTVMIERMVST